MKASIFCSTALFIFLTLFSACSDDFSVSTEQASSDNFSDSKQQQPVLFWESEGFTLYAWGDDLVFDEICSQQSLIGLNNIQVTFSTQDNTENEGYKYDIAILGDVNTVNKITNNGQTFNTYAINVNLENSSMVRIYASLTKTNFTINAAAFLTISNVKVYRLD